MRSDGGRLATLIGDLVGSKSTDDRVQLQRGLQEALRRANRLLEPRQALEPTVGDEFQGGFSNVAVAAYASVIVRLDLLERTGTDSRYGLGYGSVTVFEPGRSPVSQDGPGWWAARAAIEQARALASVPRTSFVRTCFSEWPADDAHPSPAASAIDAFLVCRDATVGQMSSRPRRLLMGSLLGRPQSELAASEEITQSAVSQSLTRSGASAIVAAHRRLEEGLA